MPYFRVLCHYFLGVIEESCGTQELRIKPNSSTRCEATATFSVLLKVGRIILKCEFYCINLR